MALFKITLTVIFKSLLIITHFKNTDILILYYAIFVTVLYLIALFVLFAEICFQ